MKNRKVYIILAVFLLLTCCSCADKPLKSFGKSISGALEKAKKF